MCVCVCVCVCVPYIGTVVKIEVGVFVVVVVPGGGGGGCSVYSDKSKGVLGLGCFLSLFFTTHSDMIKDRLYCT